MNKYLPYAIIGVLVVVAVVFVSGRLNTKTSLVSTPQKEGVITDTGPSPIPVSEVVLDDKTAVSKAIDTELNQIDKELKGINDYNLDADGLSDEQLGL